MILVLSRQVRRVGAPWWLRDNVILHISKLGRLGMAILDSDAVVKGVSILCLVYLWYVINGAPVYHGHGIHP